MGMTRKEKEQYVLSCRALFRMDTKANIDLSKLSDEALDKLVAEYKFLSRK